MIFNDNSSQTFESRVIDTVHYIKYCRHKARYLSSTNRAILLKHCVINRILRMPDNNEIIINAIQQALHPKRNFSVAEITPVVATNTPTLLDHKDDDSLAMPVPLSKDKPDSVTDDSAVDPLSTILEILYGTSPSPRHESAQSKPAHTPDPPDPDPDPQKIEDVISTLRMLANRIEDTEYRLIDILPQLGEVFEAREDVTKNVLKQTIDNLFNVFDVEKFHDVKLKPQLNTKIKQKAFLFDLLSQNYYRLKSRQEKGDYLDEALKLYRQELKGLGID